MWSGYGRPDQGAPQAVCLMIVQDQVIGIEINGDSRAYPVPILSRVEIINDRVGGIPIAVIW